MMDPDGNRFLVAFGRLLTSAGSLLAAPFRVHGSKARVSGSGFRVQGLKHGSTRNSIVFGRYLLKGALFKSFQLQLCAVINCASGAQNGKNEP